MQRLPKQMRYRAALLPDGSFPRVVVPGPQAADGTKRNRAAHSGTLVPAMFATYKTARNGGCTPRGPTNRARTRPMDEQANITAADFPEADDWEGWIELWCRDDTGNIDCVPECLRPPIMDHVRPDGWLKIPDMIPNTPYKIARWFHFGSGLPMPPWIGSGMSPDMVKQSWRMKMEELEAQAVAIEAGITDLYFIRSELGPIKIGLSGDVDKRFKALQGSSPSKLELLVVVPGGGMTEGEYHRRFAAHRLHGEWFSPHPDILAEIERLSPSFSRTGVRG